MWALFPVLLLLGLFVPGFFIAKSLRHRLWGASAFVISLLILFHSIFWLGVFGVSVRLWTVLSCLAAASVVGAWFQRRLAARAESKPAARWTLPEWMLLASSGMVGAVLVAHSAISPLLGGDMQFRWDFLAERMLALGNFSFYPPLTPADFRTYFFVDGIPPMVSFTHWWLYASAGGHLPWLISIFVGAQFVCTLAFTYGTASALYSRRTGVMAAALLAACPLYFRSVVLGQETGLTALGIAATIYFVVTARQANDVGAMVSAGMAAALCALAREYGWIAVIAGAVALVWRRQPPRQVLVFGGVAAAVAGPWYVRNWVVAGNPFYSLQFGAFAVNPIHDGILHYYGQSLGVQHWTGGTWASVLSLLLLFATFQVLAGIPGVFTRFRQQGYLLVIALLLVAVWLQSVAYTSGGVEISTRVLSPLLVVLSITGAGLLEPLMRRARWHTAILIVIVAGQLWTAGQGAIYPKKPFSLPPGQWLESAFQPIGQPAEFQVRDQLVRVLPPGYRVLSDNAYLHAALVDTGIEVVPVWSPEVRFIFSSTPEESDRRLRDLRIGSVVCYPRSLNMSYLTSASPFYASLPERWRALAQVGDFMFILGPKNP